MDSVCIKANMDPEPSTSAWLMLNKKQCVSNDLIIAGLSVHNGSISAFRLPSNFQKHHFHQSLKILHIKLSHVKTFNCSHQSKQKGWTRPIPYSSYEWLHICIVCDGWACELLYTTGVVQSVKEWVFMKHMCYVDQIDKHIFDLFVLMRWWWKSCSNLRWGQTVVMWWHQSQLHSLKNTKRKTKSK